MIRCGRVVAQVSKPAVSPISKSADDETFGRSNPTSPAGLETCATADWEVCATVHVINYAKINMVDEYDDVLCEHPDFLAEILEVSRFCYPLMELNVIRHEPDNRFLECALAASADFLITVNTARGHFDRKTYDEVHVVTPGEFLRLKELRSLLEKLAGD